MRINFMETANQIGGPLMQPTNLAITLVIMAVTLVLFLRAIVPTTGPKPDADAPKNAHAFDLGYDRLRNGLVGHFSSGLAARIRR